MNLESWSFLIVIVGVISAISFQIIEWRRQRFSKGIDTIAQMDSRWDSSEFRKIRKQAAQSLLADTNVQDSAGQEAVNQNERKDYEDQRGIGDELGKEHLEEKKGCREGSEQHDSKSDGMVHPDGEVDLSR